MSSPSSATAAGSRSSSPSTSDAFHPLDLIATQSDQHSEFLSSLHQLGASGQWDITPDFIVPAKLEDTQMLHLDELIDQHAYDDSPSSNTLSYPSPRMAPSNSLPPYTSGEPVIPSFRPTNVIISSGLISATKPIPPPASLPRKQDPSSSNHRVVCPPRESCYNLPIIVPSIPEGGAKSRVETQIRVTVDLAEASSSSDPYKYDRVGSWKWLKLPRGTATKRRTRKQGKIDPDPQDILHLSVAVTCASPPHNRVLSCSSCQAREAKRVAKKLAARVRPARSDTDSNHDDFSSKTPSKSKYVEDTTSIIQFNCAEVLDFSSGSAVLPLRITCYCRHHREKVGFNVHFTMMDHTGRIVGTGSSRPIMITDDHKTAPSTSSLRQAEYTNTFLNLDADWSQLGGHLHETTDSRAPSKRNKNSSGMKRAKPYDSLNKPTRGSREGSVASIPSPLATLSSPPMTRSPTPSSVLQQLMASDVTPIPQPPVLHHSSLGSDSSSSDALITPLDRSPDITTKSLHTQQEIVSSPSPLSLSTMVSSMVMPMHPHPVPFVFLNPGPNAPNMALQVPIIHRLIPSMGPTHGGVEVTVLGANFHPPLQLNCIFGDVAASSTQRWSDNTLVCVLPPRAAAGVVAVWLEGFPEMSDQTNTPPSLFTYADESDRALMELALQVVGLKMTGKIEDAKNVAMRIVGGGSDSSDMQSGGNNNNMVQVASLVSSARDLHSQLLFRAGESEDFESRIVDFLAILDAPLDYQPPGSLPTPEAISHPASITGQTLLHLAAFLGFPSLVTFLVNHDIDLDMRDRNGYTALHFAVLSRSEECIRVLLAAGADRNIVNAFGKTPEECTTDVCKVFDDNVSDPEWSYSDEEADWGDAEEDAEVPMRRSARKRRSRRRIVSGKSTPSCNDNRSRAATPPPDPPDATKRGDEKRADADVHNAKQAASFIDMIQRTLAQLPAPQGIIPTMPQLPLPHLPDIAIPAVPWGVLPQIMMVFPGYVPMMPGWPALFGGEDMGIGGAGIEGAQDVDAGKGVGASAIRAPQDWRATWEKWFAIAIATARQEEMPPPMYTPREVDTPAASAPEALNTAAQKETDTGVELSEIPVSPSGTGIRPVGYTMEPIPAHEVDAYGYKPSTKQTQKLQRKHDKMLLIFWLPILFMSLVWAIHSGIQFAYQALKAAFPKSPFVKYT